MPKLNFMTQGRQLSTYPTSISHEQTQTCFGRSIFGCCIYVVLLLYTPIYTRHTHCTVGKSSCQRCRLSLCVRVCRDKCDSVIYVVLDGGWGVAAAAPEQKRELVKRVGRFSSLLTLLKKKIVQTTRETAASSYFLNPPDVIYFRRGGAGASSLLDDGTKTSRD